MSASFAEGLRLFKVNWDAAIDKKTGRIGFEIIARNYKGRVLAAHSLTQSSSVDPTLAEAWATLHAFLFGKET